MDFYKKWGGFYWILTSISTYGQINIFFVNFFWWFWFDGQDDGIGADDGVPGPDDGALWWYTSPSHELIGTS